MEPTREKLQALLDSVLATEPEEIDCETFLNRAAAYLEALEVDGHLDAELARAAQHLKVCPECREEFEALLVAYGRTRRS